MPFNPNPHPQKPKIDGAAATNLGMLVFGGTAPRPLPAPKQRKEGPKGRSSNKAVGTRGENRTASELIKQGYRCTMSHMSQGLADVVATPTSDEVGTQIRYIQVKTVGVDEYEPSALNEAIWDLFGWGKYKAAPNTSIARPEAWLWIGRDEPELAAIAMVNRDWTVTVTGEKAEEVQKSINATLIRKPQLRARRKEREAQRPSLSERLKGTEAA